jgi:hypothetical protein
MITPPSSPGQNFIEARTSYAHAKAPLSRGTSGKRNIDSVIYFQVTDAKAATYVSRSR